MHKLILCIFLVLFSYGFHARANHVLGGDISVQSLGNNQYLVTLNLFVIVEVLRYMAHRILMFIVIVPDKRKLFLPP